MRPPGRLALPTALLGTVPTATSATPASRSSRGTWDPAAAYRLGSVVEHVDRSWATGTARSAGQAPGVDPAWVALNALGAATHAALGACAGRHLGRRHPGAQANNTGDRTSRTDN